MNKVINNKCFGYKKDDIDLFISTMKNAISSLKSTFSLVYPNEKSDIKTIEDINNLKKTAINTNEKKIEINTKTGNSKNYGVIILTISLVAITGVIIYFSFENNENNKKDKDNNNNNNNNL